MAITGFPEPFAGRGVIVAYRLIRAKGLVGGAAFKLG